MSYTGRCSRADTLCQTSLGKWQGWTGLPLLLPPAPSRAFLASCLHPGGLGPWPGWKHRSTDCSQHGLGCRSLSSGLHSWRSARRGADTGLLGPCAPGLHASSGQAPSKFLPLLVLALPPLPRESREEAWGTGSCHLHWAELREILLAPLCLNPGACAMGRDQCSERPYLLPAQLRRSLACLGYESTHCA